MMARRDKRLRMRCVTRLALRYAAMPWRWATESYYGLEFVRPCYYVQPALDARCTVVDCGTGREADFSRALMARFGVRAFGVDPTARHQDGLRALERSSGGRFTLLPFALSGTARRVVFFQSEDNESGSVFRDHTNVEHDRTTSYEVEALTLDELLRRTGPVDLLKLDIEGAEYAVLEGASDKVLGCIPQIVVEFHHNTVERWRASDTARLRRRLQRMGYHCHTRDFVNYLFFQGAP